MTQLLRGALVGALLMGVAAPAQAQGGLLRKLGEKAGAAKEAARRGVQQATGEAPAAPAASAAATAANTDQPARPRTVAFSENVVEITGARIDAMLAGLDAEAAARPALERQSAAAMAKYEEASRTFPARQAAYDDAHRAWSARKAKRDSCIEAVNARLLAAEQGDRESRAVEARGQAMLDDEAAMEARHKRMEALAQRMQAAQARGDQAAMMAINDTLQRELKPFTDLGRQGMAAAQRGTARSEAAQAEAKQKCGDAEPEPKSPESPSTLYPRETSERLTAAGAAAAKMDAAQYAVLKERVEAFVRARGRFGRYANWAYTAAEIAVLTERLDGLTARPEYEQRADWRVAPRG